MKGADKMVLRGENWPRSLQESSKPDPVISQVGGGFWVNHSPVWTSVSLLERNAHVTALLARISLRSLLCGITSDWDFFALFFQTPGNSLNKEVLLLKFYFNMLVAINKN